ncbi:tRNA isopentenyl-2-thiomethyl-A-37 hydroxylase MiaE [Tatumella sp. JGM118]|uniref:tRNA isopentenyl-2-thiomethyl-A-37 hydroxylase MiaE n=1 Tax=Tatumella terrea TaxID=419007 RepID=A0ABW1VU16_9GAMM|nr:tRNA isopentenyl-2-thiomethyl-A-37 hydroxylase MiaE [Tatumella sp. JGM118]MBS0910538.1 tRNA-(ms[2]io[6]A)-hydroxylase [Tatumella sp. JGM118]
MNYAALVEPLLQFLHCRTPQAWIDEASRPENLPLLLTDHLTCELKAAQTAAWLIRKYVADKPGAETLMRWLAPYEDFVYREHPDSDFIHAHRHLGKNITRHDAFPGADDLIDKMVLLIKEELHHFYQVLEIMQSRGIEYHKITASRYAKGLLREVTTHEPDTLIDKLICGAYIEARSCERFYALAPYLEPGLASFYRSLLRSEARHYQDYLALAWQISPYDITDRIRTIGETEARLITDADSELRFHSGPLIPV